MLATRSAAVALVLSALACGGSTKTDRGTGGAAGGGAASGGGGTGGSGGASTVCDQILADYEDQLEAAKRCNPIVNAVQCTQKVPDGPACGCPTFVNPANQEALENLHQVQTAWNAQGCNERVACATIECPPVQGAGCTASPAGTIGGHCIDYLPD